MTETPDASWKSWLRKVLLVVFSLCLALSVLTLWVRIQIDNTDRFVRTVEPVAADAAIQESVVVALTDRFSARLSEAQTRETLVDRQGYLAAPINALLSDYVEETVRSVVTSEEFQQFWADARRAIHPRVSAILTGSDTENMTSAAGTVTVDLAPLVDAVQVRLNERGLDIFNAAPSGPADTTITLVDSPELAEVQGLVDVLVTLAVVFPIVALIALCGYLWLSPRRRSGIICAGLAVAMSMVVLLVLFSAARWRYLDGVSTDVDRAAAAAFFDIVGRYLRWAIRLLALLGLVIAGVAFATRPESWLAQFFRARRQVAGDGQVDHNFTGLAGVMIAVICLCLITPDHLTQDWWRATLLASVLSLAVILLMSRSANRLEPAPPVNSAPISHQLVPPPPPSAGVNGGDMAGAEPTTAVRQDPSA
jgi:hypothetical protein